MAQYIPKKPLVAKIENIIADEKESIKCFEHRKNVCELTRYNARIDLLNYILSSLDTIETKEVETWHVQEKEDIYDAVKDWGLYTFVCIMKDGTIQKFTGILDEDGEGHIHVHIDGVNDDYDNVDDIVKWIELT